MSIFRAINIETLKEPAILALFYCIFEKRLIEKCTKVYGGDPMTNELLNE